MKANTAIAIVLCFVVLMVATILEGGNPMGFFNIPAFLIVVGGTFCVVTASTSFPNAMAMPKLLILAFKGAERDPRAAVRQMVAFAEKARRDGLLALEDELAEVEDEYTRKGLQLVVDGTDSDLVRTILRSEIDGMAERHAVGANLYKTASGFAPTLGILGTVMSLVHVLENLDKPETLGHSIAGAFMATLYGVGTANVIFLPIATKLKEMSAQESAHREMLLEAILAIQAGDNPRMLAERLETFLPPAQRGEEDPAEGKTPAGAGAGAPAAEAA